MPYRKQERNTKQRQIILDAVKGVKSHPTAVEVHEMVRRELPKVSLGTVYRNLELLSSKGTIRKLKSGHLEARFDGDLHPHYHVRCVRCGRVADIHGLSEPLVHEDLGKLKEAGGYKILGHRIELLGLCPDCDKLPQDDEQSSSEESGT